MSLRLWVSVLALLGVLAHAAAIPGHNAIMLASALETADQQAALAAVGEEPQAIAGLMCGADRSAGKDGPPAPAKSGSCPICMGVAPAHAILSACEPEVSAPFAVLTVRVAVRDMRIGQHRLYRPPARGPPTAS
jgi:hypothetical protein